MLVIFVKNVIVLMFLKNLKNSFLKNGILEFDLTMISQKIVITKYHEKCHLCSPARFR